MGTLRLHGALLVLLCCCAAQGGGPDPFDDLDRRKDDDALTPPESEEESRSWTHDLLHENLIFRKEVLSQFSYSHGTYSRQSFGFEILKRFSTRTATVASLNAQYRLVRRDHPIEVMNDLGGMKREGCFLEYHNLYLDLYNVLNPLLSDEGKGAHVGRFNFRIGHFYLPLGINLQTDTHATVLQLSNERSLGFERDWYAGFWGSLTRDLNYDLYYLAGSGHSPRFEGQKGMVGGRLSLGEHYDIDHGIQAGLSFLTGERISRAAVRRSPSVAAEAGSDNIVDTVRAGVDGRYTRSVPTGWLSLTTEVAAGRDESDDVLTQLYEMGYLHRSRRLGVAAQYRRFWQDLGRGPTPPGQRVPHDADSSISLDMTWYFRNDITNANLHWLKLNVERQLERQKGHRDTIVTLQYYRYW